MIAGSKMATKAYLGKLKSRFIVEKITDGHKYTFGGCKITVSENGMKRFMEICSYRATKSVRVKQEDR